MSDGCATSKCRDRLPAQAARVQLGRHLSVGVLVQQLVDKLNHRKAGSSAAGIPAGVAVDGERAAGPTLEADLGGDLVPAQQRRVL